MPREKRDAQYTALLIKAIKDSNTTVEDAAAMLDVRVDTLHGWLYRQGRAEVPKWAYNLFMLKIQNGDD